MKTPHKIVYYTLWAMLGALWGLHANAQGVFLKYGPQPGIQFSTGLDFHNTAATSANVLSTLGSQTANTILAAPNGAPGNSTFRTLVGADIPAINLATSGNGGVSGILLGTNGGTSNGFFSVTGPATALRTFTFPNASATVLTSNAAVTVAQGGTGLATLTNHGVLLGQGTSNVSAVAAMAADTLLQGQGSGSDPVAVAVNNCGSSTQALSYNTTTHAFGCQTISAGGTGTVTNVASGTGITGGPITSTGTLSIDQTASLSWTGLELFQGSLSRGGTTSQVTVGLVSSLPLVGLTNSTAGVDQKSVELVMPNTNGDFTIQNQNQAGNSTHTIFNSVRGTGIAVAAVNIGNSTDNPNINGNGVDMTPATSSYTGTLTGITATITNTMKVSRQGNIVCVWSDADFTGTSNANTMTITGTFPTGFAPAANRVVSVGDMQDNGVSSQIVGQATIAASGIISLAKLNATPQASSTNWTASGTKGINAGWSMCFPK